MIIKLNNLHADHFLAGMWTDLAMIGRRANGSLGLGLMAGLLAANLLAGGAAVAGEGARLRVIGSNVNLRAEPGLTAPVLGRVQQDQTVVEQTRQGAWLLVAIDGGAGRQGWIHSSRLQPLAPTPVVIAADAKPPVAADDAPAPAAAPEAPAPAPAPLPAAVEPAPAAADDQPAFDPKALPAEAEIAVPVAAGAAGAVDPARVENFRKTLAFLNQRALTVAGIELFDQVAPVGAGTVQVSTTEAWAKVPPTGQRSYLNTLLDQWAAAKADGGPAGVVLVDAAGMVLMEKTKP